MMPGIPPYFRLATTDQIAEMYIKELTYGVGATGIRPGLIKAATGPNQITENEEKCLQAAARAHKATGVPIMTHTDKATMGPEQLGIFESEGIDLSRVVVGHCSQANDLSYLLRILERGAYIGFDEIGSTLCKTSVLVGLVHSLVEVGYEQKIFLSQDHIGHPPERVAQIYPREIVEAIRSRKYTMIFTDFIPALLKSGISQETVDNFMIHNPRRFFAGV